jgi:hypothetical protein
MPGINDDSVERQELHCHACNGYVQFALDTSINGNHVLACPNCGHEHCRVVKDGKISDVRWDTRNGAQNNLPVYYISTSVTYTATSTVYATGSTSIYLMSASTGTGWVGY